jgi:hypothetical protein
MSLSGSIDERLWSAVQGAYEAGNYSAAIVDGVFYLRNLCTASDFQVRM